METEYLQYLKDLVEGNAEISFLPWFKQHEEELKKNLNRASFLRLKFSPIDEALKLLDASGIKYLKDEGAIRREKYYLTFDPSVLDEAGKLKHDHKRKLFGGAIGKMMDGDIEGGRKIMSTQLSKILKKKLPERADSLSDVLYFGEIELAHGDPIIGKNIVEIISELPFNQSYSDDFIIQAKKILQKPGI